MMLSRSLLALLLVTAAFASTSCQREQREGETTAFEEDAAPEPAQNGEPASGENGGPVSGGSEPVTEEGDLPPVIYYDLTRFDWYARGEPMRLEDGSYSPRGDPVRAATSEMRKVSEYEGVEYYTRDGSGSEGIVYVPVFEGFWLPFVRE